MNCGYKLVVSKTLCGLSLHILCNVSHYAKKMHLCCPYCFHFKMKTSCVSEWVRRNRINVHIWPSRLAVGSALFELLRAFACEICLYIRLHTTCLESRKAQSEMYSLFCLHVLFLRFISMAVWAWLHSFKSSLFPCKDASPHHNGNDGIY